ncbi:MAG: hypothetical protein AVDCRST_MAG18-2077 [uncultured Thermomicrobiales bacterium]|uniref:DUF3445 domain-containing protein n=1 Tax=uncultured Thermomicrobiales bacterium TaxID=1645740 RepID=A0A6J4VCT7_9BACT|nr:MAG: hypothetical protein AVDCRST_MAG18-2077 [uncultured Thermomicrobiales bacterium]
MLPHFPFDSDVYAMTMNARALAIDRLIEVEPRRYEGELAEKAAILASDYRYYFQAPGDTEAHAWEAIALLLPNMARHYPQYFALRTEGARWHWANRLLDTEAWLKLGESASLPLPPLDWLGRQVQEDLLIMAEDAAGGTPLVAGHLCFAAGWCLDDKLGRSFLAIHDPVPIFADRVGRSADLLMQRLKPDHPTGRVGWSITTSPELNRAPAVTDGRRDEGPTIDALNAGERCYLRLERQTFSRLPRTRGVLFTIHTSLTPLAGVLAEDAPARARRVAAVLRTMPAPLLRYKGIDRFQAPLLAYLDAQAAGDEATTGDALR